jgi:hypothetical protein
MMSMGLLWAEGKGFGYWSNASTTDRMRDLNNCYGLQKWGWVVYRCTYGDDPAWHRFIEMLIEDHTEYLTDEFVHAEDLIPSYDWVVQEDPSLEGATKDEVRRRFRQFRTSLREAETPATLEDHKKLALIQECPRYNFCIHVGAEALQSVLREGCAYTGPAKLTSSHVNLVRADDSWDLPDFDRFDWAQYETQKEAERQLRRESNNRVAEEADDDEDDFEDDEDDEYDDREVEIEGSRLNDVGWMKVRISSLIEVYALLQRVWTWDNIYSRPPQVAEY